MKFPGIDGPTDKHLSLLLAEWKSPGWWLQKARSKSLSQLLLTPTVCFKGMADVTRDQASTQCESDKNKEHHSRPQLQKKKKKTRKAWRGLQIMRRTLHFSGLAETPSLLKTCGKEHMDLGLSYWPHCCISTCVALWWTYFGSCLIEGGRKKEASTSPPKPLT